MQQELEEGEKPYRGRSWIRFGNSYIPRSFTRAFQNNETKGERNYPKNTTTIVFATNIRVKQLSERMDWLLPVRLYAGKAESFGYVDTPQVTLLHLETLEEAK